ncbi:MAG: hypothetical protein N2C14_29370 [Planctomycetales bacterium]
MLKGSEEQKDAKDAEDLAWSPDGKRIALANQDSDFVRAWRLDGSDGEYRDKHFQDAKRVAWSPDGLTLAVAAKHDDKWTVILWTVDDETQRMFEGNREEIEDLAWSGDENRIVAARRNLARRDRAPRFLGFDVRLAARKQRGHHCEIVQRARRGKFSPSSFRKTTAGKTKRRGASYTLRAWWSSHSPAQGRKFPAGDWLRPRGSRKITHLVNHSSHQREITR